MAGESAGGNLAAVVALNCRDTDGPALNLQCLLYPVTDHAMKQPSYQANGEGYLLETKTMQWFWDTYCPDKPRRDEPSAAPSRATSFADLAPAVVVTAEFDPLRDEGQAYAQALQAAGNTVHATNYDGLVHDFFGTAAVFECSRPGFLATVEHIKHYLN